MKFEVLKRSHVKRNIILGVVAVLIISAVVLTFTRAKYRVTESIPLVNGTINYIPYDFKVIALYQENSSGQYVEVDQMPSNGYVINESESYCTVDGTTKDENAIVYTNSSGEHVIANLQKRSKCYLYFDEYISSASNTILDNYSVILTRNSFNDTVTETTTGTIYQENTSKRTTYYFAGNPTDNWVRFAGFSWRIVRINEDGTVRLIYQGITNNVTGTETQLGTSAFNSSYNNNAYVGYMYTIGSLRGYNTYSEIKIVLDEWYRNNLLEYDDYIDGNAGFCGDRTPSTNSSSSNGLGGTGTTRTYYGSQIRVERYSPTLECADGDLYTTAGSNDGNRELDYPIGLISADEVVYAGSKYAQNNTFFYLYTGQGYWTMLPYEYDGIGADVFYVSSNGRNTNDSVTESLGIRPVINLKADVSIVGGNGMSYSPYIIET